VVDKREKACPTHTIVKVVIPLGFLSFLISPAMSGTMLKAKLLDKNLYVLPIFLIDHIDDFTGSSRPNLINQVLNIHAF
jgi:hypothetical protein